MDDPEVVIAKIDVIGRCLARLEEVRDRQRREDIPPLDAEDITALNLLRAVQAAIDLAAHIVSEEGFGTPTKTSDLFTMLGKRGVIGGDLAVELSKMVGFRNVAVHDYQSLDPAIVESIVEHHLDDLRALGDQVVRHFGLQN